MKHTVAILFWGASVQPIAAHAQVDIKPGSEMNIVDVHSLPLPGSLFTYDDEQVVPLSDSGQEVPISSVPQMELPRPASRSALANTLSIRRQLLSQAPAVDSRDSEVVFRDSQPLMSLPIDREEIIFSVIESNVDPEFPTIRHLTAVVLNVRGYARFAIDDASGKIAGTIDLPSATYRILSSNVEQIQMVFRLPLEAGGINGYLELTRFMSAAPEVSRVEQRHLLAEALADTQPSLYIENGRTVVIDGDVAGQDRLGQVDLSQLENPDGIARFLNDMAPITRARGDEEYRIVRVVDRPRNLGSFVEFQQLLNGIPIGKINKLEVWPDGRVKRLQVTLFNPQEFAIQEARLSEHDASQAALLALQQQFPGAAIEQRTDSSEVDYQVTAGSRLTPTWRSQFHINFDGVEHLYLVVINMHSGEVGLTRSGAAGA